MSTSPASTTESNTLSEFPRVVWPAMERCEPTTASPSDSIDPSAAMEAIELQLPPITTPPSRDNPWPPTRDPAADNELPRQVESWTEAAAPTVAEPCADIDEPQLVAFLIVVYPSTLADD